LGKGIEDIFLEMEIVELGDTYKLNIDGLHEMLSDPEIKNITSKAML
jgi:hypothetical protein